MNPYSNLPANHFWSSQITETPSGAIDYDPAPKWRFDMAKDKFATAGSRFAQNFTRYLRVRGGNYVEAEQRHHLIPEDAGHGYGIFSARYGNIYTCRQLRELIEQAFEVRPPLLDFFETANHRWIDLLRLRAVPDGFSSFEDARLDRLYHLGRVAAMFDQASVFVFTLGLTESWINTQDDSCYPVCPGVIKGAFQPEKHKFQNLSFDQCFGDLSRALEMIHNRNPNLRILLTVSPVMLVATYEPRGALQSSIASKAILRTVADQCTRTLDYVDYFPSFEIITGPQSGGRFYKLDNRDVTADGVEHVMNVFFESRFREGPEIVAAPAKPPAEVSPTPYAYDCFDDECDEVLLGKGRQIN